MTTNSRSSTPPRAHWTTGSTRGHGKRPTRSKDGLAHAELGFAQAPLRRLPAQQRSMLRVQRMLDCCAELLDEVGYANLSTTRIAERAGVAIGSVYQFFPDKKAITQALGLRFLDQFAARFTDRLSGVAHDDWIGAIDAVVDEYVDMHRTVTGFRSLHFGDIVDPQLLDRGVDNNRVISVRLRQIIVSHNGLPDSEELDRAFHVSVEAADAVLKLAFRHDPEGHPELIAEAKRLVLSYLSRFSDPGGGDDPW